MRNDKGASWTDRAQAFPTISLRDTLRAKFRSLGVDSEADLRPLLRIITRIGDVPRGRDITAISEAHKSAIILLEGVACWFRKPAGGHRQILAFQYPGDLLDFHRYVLPKFGETISIRALTACSVGIARYEDIEPAIDEHPNLGLALWRATMLTAMIWRERMLQTVHATALMRVAHLLCEQLARLEAIGVNTGIVPLSQSEVADAAGLSPVHVNRTIQHLRKVGALRDNRGGIEVGNRRRLMQIANFDAGYLNMPVILSNWDVKIGQSRD